MSTVLDLVYQAELETFLKRKKISVTRGRILLADYEKIRTLKEEFDRRWAVDHIPEELQPLADQTHTLEFVLEEPGDPRRFGCRTLYRAYESELEGTVLQVRGKISNIYRFLVGQESAGRLWADEAADQIRDAIIMKEDN